MQPRSSQRHGLSYAVVPVVCATHDDGSAPESAIASAGSNSGADEVAYRRNVAAARWEVFLDAEADVRGVAFRSYVAALDAEEAAATELAARRSIAFISRTSILAPRSDRERGAPARHSVGDLMLHVACPQQAALDARVQRHHA